MKTIYIANHSQTFATLQWCLGFLRVSVVLVRWRSISRGRWTTVKDRAGLGTSSTGGTLYWTKTSKRWSVGWWTILTRSTTIRLRTIPGDRRVLIRNKSAGAKAANRQTRLQEASTTKSIGFTKAVTVCGSVICGCKIILYLLCHCHSLSAGVPQVQRQQVGVRGVPSFADNKYLRKIYNGRQYAVVQENHFQSQVSRRFFRKPRITLSVTFPYVCAWLLYTHIRDDQHHSHMFH